MINGYTLSKFAWICSGKKQKQYSEKWICSGSLLDSGYPSFVGSLCRWVPPANRGKAISTIYAASSSGTVLGLMTTPVLAQLLGGWPACFLLFAGLGIVWAVSPLLLLLVIAALLVVKLFSSCNVFACKHTVQHMTDRQLMHIICGMFRSRIFVDVYLMC